MKVLRNDMNGIRVKFNGHLRPFEATVYLCANPDCPCTTVTLELTEIEADGADVSNPIHFRFKLDIETWQKHPDTNFSEPINALIDEFVHDLSDELKTTFTEAYDRKQERRRKFANFTMPTEDIRRGFLVSFSEVMSGTEDYDRFPDYGFKFTTQDHTYYIDDLYCPNPKCDCKNVCLLFLKQEKAVDGKTTLTEAFTATLSLKGKNLGFLRLGKYSQSQVAELVNQWLESDPEVIDLFFPRYNEIRKATKRILKTNRNSSKNIKLVHLRSADGFNPKPDLLSAKDTAERLPPSAFPKKVDSPVGKTGRNDPCPCGSGKKYKKCCFNQK